MEQIVLILITNRETGHGLVGSFTYYEYPSYIIN